jgi:hypothetical protein
MTLTIAAIAQRWRLVVPDDVDLQLKVSTTVRLRSGLPAVVEARGDHAA